MLKEELMEAVLARENLRAAWLAVKANDGAPGVDGLSVSATKEHIEKHWEGIEAKLRAGQYKPAAVRGVEIPKAGGKTRTLGIPTVQDRLIQQAILQVLGPIFDPGFSEQSYGFRPKRSAHDAVRAAQSHIAAGREWVVDIDLKSFFDQVDHDLLMRQVAQKVRDKTLLRLIGSYLRAPMQRSGEAKQARSQGTPQGGPLSPLLANISLDPLDKELERRGAAFVRYADDIAIYAGSERAAARMLESIVGWLRREWKLEVNAEKSGVGPTDQSALLGFRLYRDGRLGVAPRSVERFKTSVKRRWDARQSKTSQELREQWEQYSRGWWNYFAIIDWRREVENLSGWVRRHIRKCFWLRWHHWRGRRAALARLGVSGRALGLASSSLGAWRMARHVVMQQALKTTVLRRYGLDVPWALAAK